MNVSLTVIELLKAARALIAKPNGWTQRQSARNSAGITCSVDAKDATCFCLLGSVRRAAIDLGSTVATHAQAVDLLYDLSPNGPQLVRWNDTPGRTQAEVVDLLDVVIAKATTAEFRRGQWV